MHFIYISNKLHLFTFLFSVKSRLMKILCSQHTTVMRASDYFSLLTFLFSVKSRLLKILCSQHTTVIRAWDYFSEFIRDHHSGKVLTSKRAYFSEHCYINLWHDPPCSSTQNRKFVSQSACLNLWANFFVKICQPTCYFRCTPLYMG